MLDCCQRHPHEAGVDLCGRCGHAWCDACLVYSFGQRKPPFCLSCAMVAGGVRTGAALPPMPKKAIKEQRKALKAEAKAAAKAAKGAPRAPEAEPEPASAPAPDPEPTLDAEPVPVAFDDSATSWSNPWWEDSREAALAD